MNFKLALKFLADLNHNNHKEWLDQNRSTYSHLIKIITDLGLIKSQSKVTFTFMLGYMKNLLLVDFISPILHF